MHQNHQAGLPQLTSDRQPLDRSMHHSCELRCPPQPGQWSVQGVSLMADKLFSVPAAAIVSMVGRLEASAMAELDLALRG